MGWANRILQKAARVPKWAYLLVALVLVARMLLPITGKRVINDALRDRLGEYTGAIEDFDLSLHRGAYQLQGLVVQKGRAAMDPILRVAEIDLSLSWKALLRREISADITIDGAVVTFTDSKESNTRQLGTEEKGWRGALDVLIPVHIENLVLHRSALRLTFFDFKGAPPLTLDQIEFSAQDLRSRKGAGRRAFGPFRLSARAQGHAALTVGGHVDILSTPPRADLDFQLERMKIPSLNKLLIHYLPLDFTSGTLDLYGECATENGDLKGYGKIFLEEGVIIAPKQKFLSVRHFAIEMVSAFADWFLENSKSKNVAVTLPFEAKAGKWNVDGAAGVWSAVKNLWNVLPKGVDHTIDLRSVEQMKKAPAPPGPGPRGANAR